MTIECPSNPLRVAELPSYPLYSRLVVVNQGIICMFILLIFDDADQNGTFNIIIIGVFQYIMNVYTHIYVVST